MISKELLTNILGLTDIEILDIKLISNNTLYIYVNSTKEGCHCHQCGKATQCYYGKGQEIVLRHLPILNYKTYIVLKTKRYQCENCHDKPTTTQILDWYKPKSKMTKLFEDRMLLELINSTTQDVSLKNNISYSLIEGLLDRYYENKIDWTTIDNIDAIGIDEIALKKGHRDFIVIVSAYIKGCLTVLAVLKNRLKETVKEFFLSIPKRLRKTVKAVCSDLYLGFINAAKEVFGKKIAVIADRFHVAKLYREGFESLRKKEMKRLKKELSKEKYASLSKTMWLLRKPFNELTSDEVRQINAVFVLSPLLKLAYDLCLSLSTIYTSHINKGSAKRKMKGWITQVKNSQLTCFNSFIKTLTKHIEEITNYFIERKTSGFVEGLNNKIKVLKRRCYGLTNVNRLFKRLRLDLGGYREFGVQ